MKISTNPYKDNPRSDKRREGQGVVKSLMTLNMLKVKNKQGDANLHLLVKNKQIDLRRLMVNVCNGDSSKLVELLYLENMNNVTILDLVLFEKTAEVIEKKYQVALEGLEKSFKRCCLKDVKSNLKSKLGGVKERLNSAVCIDSLNEIEEDLDFINKQILAVSNLEHQIRILYDKGNDNPLIVIDELGQGYWGEVDKVRGGDGSVFALKRSKVACKYDNHTCKSLRDEAVFTACLFPERKIEFVRVDGKEGMLMPFYDGLDLYEVSKQKINPLEILKVAQDMAQDLRRIHDMGLIHYDLKPENVMRTKAGGTHIVDFGLTSSKIMCFELKDSKNTRFQSLEVVFPKGSAIDNKLDIYSYGLILYELVTNKDVDCFDSEESFMNRQKIMIDNLNQLKKKSSNKAVFVDLILECIKESPDERPSIDVVIEILGKYNIEIKIG